MLTCEHRDRRKRGEDSEDSLGEPAESKQERAGVQETSGQALGD